MEINIINFIKSWLISKIKISDISLINLMFIYDLDKKSSQWIFAIFFFESLYVLNIVNIVFNFIKLW